MKGESQKLKVETMREKLKQGLMKRIEQDVNKKLHDKEKLITDSLAQQFSSLKRKSGK
jgi:hypothetical protein